MDKFLFWLSRKINYPLVAPEILQISLTYRCNLRCRMCTLAGLLPKEDELSTQQIFRIVDEAKAYGIKTVLLTGGEPFLREDIFEICGYIYHQGLRSVITTNGAIINDSLIKQIKFLKKAHIHFSIDGLEKTHDYFRGQGVFNKAIRAIKVLEKENAAVKNISLGIACTVMDENVEELYSIFKLAGDLRVDAINFQPLVADNSNFLNKEKPAHWVTPAKIKYLGQQVSKIKECGLNSTMLYEEPMLELLLPYYKGELKPKDWVCFGGFKTVFICFEKKQPLVYTCHGICGNLNDISLKKAWRSNEAYQQRIHSQTCKNLCLQSCYSYESAQSLSNVLRNFYQRGSQ